MRTIQTPPDTGRSVLRVLDSHAELGSALQYGLGLPLSALRASMESLNRSLPADAQGHGVLEGALHEVERLGRNVRDLMDYAQPPRPMPMRCTPIEIAASARAGLPDALRERVIFARIGEKDSLHLDAPLVAQCLRRLIENAFEAGSDNVLLLLRDQGNRFAFSVIDGASSAFDPYWAHSTLHPTHGAHLGLGLALAERDIQLQNGRLEVTNLGQGEASATITFPYTVPGNPEGVSPDPMVESNGRPSNGEEAA